MTKRTTHAVYHAVLDDTITILGDNAAMNFGHAHRIAAAAAGAALQQNGAPVHTTLAFNQDELVKAMFKTICEQAGLDIKRAADELLFRGTES